MGTHSTLTISSLVPLFSVVVLVSLSSAEVLPDYDKVRAAEGEELIRFATHPNWGVRREAVLRMGRPGFELGVEPLMAALDDSEEVIRKFAARSLGDIGPEAQKALPKLLVLVQRDTGRQDEHVKAAAIRAVSSIAPQDRGFLPLLVRLLQQEKDGLLTLKGRAVHDALEKIGPPAVPHVLILLQEGPPDARVKKHVVALLAKFGEAAKEAPPLLTRILKGPNGCASNPLGLVPGVGRAHIYSDLHTVTLEAIGQIGGSELRRSVEGDYVPTGRDPRPR